MVSATPEKKRMFPMAISPLSKKKIIPKNEKNTPNPVNPSPIFFRSFISKETIVTQSKQIKSNFDTYEIEANSLRNEAG